MSLIMMLVVLVLFILLLLLSIIFKKKILLYVILCLTVITGGCYILMNTVFYYNSDSVSVSKNENESFRIEVKNHRIKYAGSDVEFGCKYSKQELYDKISKQYDNIFFDEKFNQIVVVSDNDIYTINDCGSSSFCGIKKYGYLLSRDFVSMDISDIDKNTEYLHIPFPLCAVISQGSLIEENITLRCGFAHLKQYYESFTNVNIGADTIEIMLEKYKCIITVNGENTHFEIVEI